MSILEDSHGNLWFCYGMYGVSKYNGETFTQYTENEGLSHNRVLVHTWKTTMAISGLVPGMEVYASMMAKPLPILPEEEGLSG